MAFTLCIYPSDPFSLPHFHISVRGQENGLDGTKSGGPSGRGTERGRRGRGRGRGNQFVEGWVLGVGYSLVL